MGVVVEQEEGRAGAKGQSTGLDGPERIFDAEGLSTFAELNALDGFSLSFFDARRVFNVGTGAD